MDDPIVSGGVDALLVLAYRHFHYQNRATYNPTFAFLDRSLTLLGATLSSTSFLTTIPFSSSTHIAICALSSTCANIGASLFNNGKAGDAIRFLRRSRELGAFVTNFAMEDDTSEGVQESREYLKKGLSRRSETLAMAYQATGDKLVGENHWFETRESNVNFLLFVGTLGRPRYVYLRRRRAARHDFLGDCVRLSRISQQGQRTFSVI